MSGTSLTIVTGIAAGLLVLATAAAGFHDLAGGADIPAQRFWRTGDPSASTGLAAAFGAVVGLTVGLIAQGPDGIALCSAIGAGVGVGFGAALDTSRTRRAAAAELLSNS